MTTKYEYHDWASNCGTGSLASYTTWTAQTFKPVIAHVITEVRLTMYDVTGTIIVEIKAVDGDGKPTGAALATGTIGSAVGSTYPFALSPFRILAAGTQYAIVVHAQNPGKSASIYRDRVAGVGQLDWVSNDSGVSWTAPAAHGPCDPWPYWHTDLANVFSEWGDPPAALAVTTNPATAVGQTTATPNATLDEGGGYACEVRFEYGETTDYGKTTEWQSSKETGDAVSQEVRGLKSGTVYHFRVQARNSAGTANGSDRTFHTAALSSSAHEALGRSYPLGRTGV